MKTDKVDKIWRKHLICECGYHSVVEKLRRKKLYTNFKIEERLQKNIGVAYLNDIFRFSQSLNCKNISQGIYEAQKSLRSSILEGPVAEFDEEIFCFLKSSKSYPKIFKGPLTDQLGSTIFDDPQGSPISDVLEKKFELGLISPAMLNQNIGNSLGFNWATFFSKVIKDIEEGLEPDGVRDKMGLDIFSLYGKDDFVFLLVYNVANIENKSTCPTVLQGGNFHAFHPSKSHEPTGFTLNLGTGLKGYPEIVHTEISNSPGIITDIFPVGKLEKDPSNNYLEKEYE